MHVIQVNFKDWFTRVCLIARVLSSRKILHKYSRLNFSNQRELRFQDLATPPHKVTGGHLLKRAEVKALMKITHRQHKYQDRDSD